MKKIMQNKLLTDFFKTTNPLEYKKTERKMQIAAKIEHVLDINFPTNMVEYCKPCKPVTFKK